MAAPKVSPHTSKNLKRKHAPGSYSASSTKANNVIMSDRLASTTISISPKSPLSFSPVLAPGYFEKEANDIWPDPSSRQRRDLRNRRTIANFPLFPSFWVSGTNLPIQTQIIHIPFRPMILHPHRPFHDSNTSQSRKNWILQLFI